MLKPKFSSWYFLRTCLVNVWYYNQSGLDEGWSLEAVEWLNKSSQVYSTTEWFRIGSFPGFFILMIQLCEFALNVPILSLKFQCWFQCRIKHVFIVNLILKRTRESEVWWLPSLSFHEKLIKSSSSTVEIKCSFKRWFRNFKKNWQSFLGLLVILAQGVGDLFRTE